MLLELRTHAVFSATKANEENPRPRMLKRYFLSERTVLNAILRVQLKYMKDVSFHEMNVICNAEQIFHVLELFCSKSVRASMPESLV